jgi:hypothetical protein
MRTSALKPEKRKLETSYVRVVANVSFPPPHSLRQRAADPKARDRRNSVGMGRMEQAGVTCLRGVDECRPTDRLRKMQTFSDGWAKASPVQLIFQGAPENLRSECVRPLRQSGFGNLQLRAFLENAGLAGR